MIDMAIVWLVLSAVPVAISVWALLDAARRPPWAWALAGRSQVSWLGAIAFGILLLAGGLVIATWYLLRVRPAVRRVEEGNFAGFEIDDGPAQRANGGC